MKDDFIQKICELKNEHISNPVSRNLYIIMVFDF